MMARVGPSEPRDFVKEAITREIRLKKTVGRERKFSKRSDLGRCYCDRLANKLAKFSVATAQRTSSSCCASTIALAFKIRPSVSLGLFKSRNSPIEFGELQI
jgi:hypothetical protein